MFGNATAKLRKRNAKSEISWKPSTNINAEGFARKLFQNVSFFRHSTATQENLLSPPKHYIHAPQVGHYSIIIIIVCSQGRRQFWFFVLNRRCETDTAQESIKRHVLFGQVLGQFGNEIYMLLFHGFMFHGCLVVWVCVYWLLFVVVCRWRSRQGNRETSKENAFWLFSHSMAIELITATSYDCLARKSLVLRGRAVVVVRTVCGTTTFATTATASTQKHHPSPS